MGRAGTAGPLLLVAIGEITVIMANAKQSRGRRDSRRQELNSAVRKLLDPNASSSDKEAAAAVLREAAIRVARMVNARHFGGSFDEATLEDVVQDLILKVFDGKYNPDAGSSFINWAYTVIKNALVDRAEKQSKEMVVTDITAASGDASPYDEDNGDDADPGGSFLFVEPGPDPRDIAAEREPFCAHDLEVLTAIPVRDRIILLVLAGIHHRVPRNTWLQWCNDAGLSNSFPPPHLLGVGPEHGRAKALAEELRVKPDTLHAVWHRKKRYLQKLKAMQV